MDKLLNITLILWVFSLLSKQWLPEAFGNQYFQWPLFFILACIVPYGFAKSIFLNKKSRAIVFLLIPLCNLVLLTCGNHLGHALIENMQFIHPSHKQNSKLLSLPLKAPTEENRYIAARMVYVEFGVSVPYKTINDEFVQYEPTEEDIKKYNNQASLYHEGNELMSELVRQNNERSYLALLQVIVFALVFCITYCFSDLKNSGINKNKS